jgi:hypothetical protein
MWFNPDQDTDISHTPDYSNPSLSVPCFPDNCYSNLFFWRGEERVGNWRLSSFEIESQFISRPAWISVLLPVLSHIAGMTGMCHSHPGAGWEGVLQTFCPGWPQMVILLPPEWLGLWVWATMPGLLFCSLITIHQSCFWTSCKWNHIICNLLCLTSFIQH